MHHWSLLRPTEAESVFNKIPGDLCAPKSLRHAPYSILDCTARIDIQKSLCPEAETKLSHLLYNLKQYF